MSDNRPLDPIMRSAIIGVAVSAVLFSIAATLSYGWRTGGGVLCGGVIATANLVVFVQIGRAFLRQRGGGAPWAVIGGLKLILLIGGGWLIIRSGIVSGFALAAGYAALPVGITFGSLFGKRPDDSDSSAD